MLGWNELCSILPYVPSLHDSQHPLRNVISHRNLKKVLTHYLNVSESIFLGSLGRIIKSDATLQVFPAFPNHAEAPAYSPRAVVHHHSGEVIQATLRAAVLGLQNKGEGIPGLS